MRFLLRAAFLLGMCGCAGAGALIGMAKPSAPPEFNQKIILDVSEKYALYQSPRSTYNIGDLQSFQSQQTFPVVTEDAFKEIFGQVVMRDPEQTTEAQAADAAALFEAAITDLSHDVYTEGDNFRSEVTIGAAMKDPASGRVVWQQSFRGQGYVRTDLQPNLGPQDAVVDAIRDALSQMQRAILGAPEVRSQMKEHAEAGTPKPQPSPQP